MPSTAQPPPGFGHPHTFHHHGHVHFFKPHAGHFHVFKPHVGHFHAWVPHRFHHPIAPLGTVVIAPGWYWTGWNWVWVVPR